MAEVEAPAAETPTVLHRVFVYGTLKTGEPNHHWLTDPEKGFSKFVTLAETFQPWPLVIATRYNIPFLMFKEDFGLIVVGEVYDVDDAMFEALDELEDYPDLYERKQYDVVVLPKSDDGPQVTTRCWIYFLVQYPAHILKLPFYCDYSSDGPHGLKYISNEHLTGKQILELLDTDHPQEQKPEPETPV